MSRRVIVDQLTAEDHARYRAACASCKDQKHAARVIFRAGLDALDLEDTRPTRPEPLPTLEEIEAAGYKDPQAVLDRLKKERAGEDPDELVILDPRADGDVPPDAAKPDLPDEVTT